jgi:hypothetical protein
MLSIWQQIPQAKKITHMEQTSCSKVWDGFAQVFAQGVS